MDPKIDNYLAEGCGRCPLGSTPECKVHNWTDVLEQLRIYVNDCGLTEELKWGVPCYTYQNANIVIMSALKEYCALGFFKGALLNDTEGILSKPGENSQAVRQFRFTDVKDVKGLEAIIKAYIYEAIEVEKAGLKIEFRKNPEPVPEELEKKLEEDPVFRNAFEALTPGRQRGYILHFSQPKQSKTRVSRIEKWTEKILNGEGMHDAYRAGKK